MDRKIKIGVLGGYRGSSMINYCERADNAEVVAICDKSAEVLNCQREKLKDENITYFDNFEDFIKHDMDDWIAGFLPAFHTIAYPEIIIKAEKDERGRKCFGVDKQMRYLI